MAPSPSRSIDLSSLAGRIVFSNEDIWSINANGTDLRRLTDAPWREFDPALSPDGRFIAYRSEPHDYPELWLMRADGTGQHQLSPSGGFPDWSADGSLIAFADPGGASHISWIGIMNADGSARRRLRGTDNGEYPSWSADGQRIAYSQNTSGSARMAIVTIDGSQIEDLASVGEGGKVAWSPDGRLILFQSQRDQTGNATSIYTMQPDGSAVVRLTQMNAETAGWSPDGRYIVFSWGGLYIMRADGSDVTALPTGAAGEVAFPDWQ